MLFPALLHHYESHSGECRIISHDVAGLYLLLFQTGDHLVAPFVLPNASYKSHSRSQARCRHRLIGSLATRRQLKLVALGGFPALRQARSTDLIIRIGPTHDDDVPAR